MKKPKQPTPKNLFVRYVENGKKISVGEYLRAKWRKVVDPFKLDDENAVRDLRVQIDLFKQRANRPVELINYSGSGAAEALSAAMDKIG